jgi:ribosomal protein S18 acetylase RimI-like enzyme
MPTKTFAMSEIVQINDVDHLSALTALTNDAYRGSSGSGRWTSEAHLVSGPRMTEAAMTALIRDSGTNLYAVFEEAGPIGCIAAVKVSSDTIELGCFAVAPHLHGGGLGRHLLGHAERACSERCARFQVMVVSENDALISFYQKRGYVLTGARKPYPLAAGVGIPLKSDLDLVVLQKASR